MAPADILRGSIDSVDYKEYSSTVTYLSEPYGEGHSMSSEPAYVSAADLLNRLFNGELASAEYDPEVVALVRKHIGGNNLASRAGTRLAEDLAALAKLHAAKEQT